MTSKIVIYVIIGIIVVLSIFLNRKNKEETEIKTDEDDFRDNEYSEELLKTFKYAVEKKKENTTDFYVDDITFNDLELNDVFSALDYSSSSLGREYIYSSLRFLKTKKEALKKRENLVTVFEDKKLCQEMEEELSNLGHISAKNGSFIENIDRLKKVKTFGNKTSILLNAALIFGIQFTFFKNPAFGIVFLLATLITSTVIYFKNKPIVEENLFALAILTRLINVSENVRGLIKGNKELEEVYNRLSKSLATVSKIRKNAWMLSDSGSINSYFEVILNYVRMVTHIDLIHYNNTITKMRLNEKEIEELINTLGDFELAISILKFRKALKNRNSYAIPRFLESDEAFKISEIYHPLIKNAVVNDIEQGEKSILVTGSNASGKSTFLKAVAINIILAQTINTVAAKEYAAPFLKVISSMSLRDDLKHSGSYYMVEIKSLKRIVDLAKESDIKVVCFIDEILRGTNTIERIAASSIILDELSKENAVVFAATHDIELTSLIDKNYKNYHFKEDVTEEGISFSYKLQEGAATTKNAILLLEKLGYDKEIIRAAKMRAENFEKNNIWK